MKASSFGSHGIHMSMQRHKREERKTMTKRKSPSYFSFNLSAVMQNKPYDKVMKEKKKNNAKTQMSSPFIGSPVLFS